MSYLGNPPFPDTETLTIASYASLVGRSEVKESLGNSKLFRMTEALFKSRGYLINKYPYLASMTESFSSGYPEYPLYDGSIDYYSRNKPIAWDLVTLWVSSMFSLIFLVITIISFLHGKRKLPSGPRHPRG